MKFSQWITAQLKEAQAKGEPLSLRELINQNLNMFEGETSSGRVPRTARVKKDVANPNINDHADESIASDTNIPTTV